MAGYCHFIILHSFGYVLQNSSVLFITIQPKSDSPLSMPILRLRINKLIHLLGITVPPCQGMRVLWLRFWVRM